MAHKIACATALHSLISCTCTPQYHLLKCMKASQKYSLQQQKYLLFLALIIHTKFTLEELRNGQMETTLDQYWTPGGR